jgi:fructose-bisphosphate aldolase class II
VERQYGKAARFDLVFHGGSGSSQEEIHEAVDYGVAKMNIDTDTQYAFTRAIADHMFKNYRRSPEGGWRGGGQEEL